MPALPSGRNGDLHVSPDDRAVLGKWSRSRTLAVRVVVRSRILLMLADGHTVAGIADALDVAPATVRLWARRFRESGPQGLLRDAPGRGRKPLLDSMTRLALRAGVESARGLTLQEHARQLGVSASTISRWRRRNE
jgi:transposase